MVAVNRLTTRPTCGGSWWTGLRAANALSTGSSQKASGSSSVVNEMDSDHPMHHPFHLHGAGRFLVLARDGVPESNLVWKDTVLVRTGQTVDILFDITNPACGWRTATCRAHAKRHDVQLHRGAGHQPDEHVKKETRR